MSAPSAEQILRARAAELSMCLHAVAACVGRAETSRDAYVVTGIGASEGPARAMAALLRATWGTRAVFAPLSTFAIGEPRAHGDVLVVFSQSLSPNACLALERAREFRRGMLFTSMSPRAADGEAERVLDRFRERGVVVQCPEQGSAAAGAIAREKGTLVRVLGPCAATLAGALHVGAATAEDIPLLQDAVERAPARARDATSHIDAARLEGRVAFVTAGEHGELCSGVGSLWQEALYAPRPPSWDVLQIAHGPFQELYESPMLLVALERAGAEAALFDRLAAMLVPERHVLVRLRSALPASLAPLDHFAQVLELVCRALRDKPRDLRAWPGRGRDGPLYELGMKRARAEG